MFEDQDTLWDLFHHLSVYSLSWISLIFAGVFLMIFGFYNLYLFSNQSSISCPVVQERKVETLVSIDVSGAIKKPGIYQLQQSSRIADAISLAGGFSKEADMQYVAQSLNLARLLKDQEKIYVPFLGEKQITEVNSKISINNASMEQLLLINGVGEKKAEMIVQNRPFTDLTDLVTKKIISETVLSQVIDDIEL